MDEPLLDYQHPDLCWKTPPVNIGHDSKGEIFGIGGRRFRVYAKQGSNRHISIYGGSVWRCTRIVARSYEILGLKSGHVCDYYPCVEETPPLPGQRCHGCHQLRAQWIDNDSPVFRREHIQGPRYIAEYHGYEWLAIGLVLKRV